MHAWPAISFFFVIRKTKLQTEAMETTQIRGIKPESRNHHRDRQASIPGPTGSRVMIKVCEGISSKIGFSKYMNKLNNLEFVEENRWWFGKAGFINSIAMEMGARWRSSAGNQLEQNNRLLVDLIYNMSPLVPNNITIIIDETNNMVALYLVGRRTH